MTIAHDVFRNRSKDPEIRVKKIFGNAGLP